ncbi:MAG: DEAD/DEAH box helicase [Bacteroidota bacterium]
MTFSDFDLHEQLMLGLSDMGFNSPTPIQEQSIPLVLGGKDVLGAAQTGTGKTGAFVIPLIQQLLTTEDRTGIQALILSPTRELAHQIDEQIFALGYHASISSATIIGGEDFARQAEAIRSGVDILVATPGRLIDQIKVLDIDFSNIKYLVLDEADRMLDMGFLPDVNHIIDKLPADRQTLLFSATMPKQIKSLAESIQKNPEPIEIEVSKPSNRVEQWAFKIYADDKLKLAQYLLENLQWKSCIIFTATKKGTNQLERLLKNKGINAGSIHGDREQEERTKALQDFKNGTVPVIVATDVLARGIDIDDVSLIINYDVPRAVEDYIHRIGRTGRYDKEGLAITFVSKNDSRFFKAIQDKVGDDLIVKPLPKKTTEETQEKPKPAKSSKPSVEVKLKPKTADKAKKQDKEPSKQNKKTEQRGKNQHGGQGSNKTQKHTPKKKPNQKPKQEPVKELYPAVRIEKATERNQDAPKPAKGYLGLIKSWFR